MDYVELSTINVKGKCNELYEIIIDNYQYELVIFVAKGSYIIGKKMSDLQNVPLLEICAMRKAGRIKKVLKPLFRIIPKKILIMLRKREMNSSYHDKNENRQVSFNEEKYKKYKNIKKILLVDDSIDSGNSIIETRKVLNKYFDNAEIKVAVFNVMDKSAIIPDYYLYKNTMINGPWSSDSKENKSYIKEYEKWKENYEK
mgnify:CR=1 FL=1